MTKNTVPVEGLKCAVCAANVEKKVNSVQGVSAATVNFAANTLTVEYDGKKTSMDEIQKEVRSLGFDLLLDVNEEELNDPHLHRSSCAAELACQPVHAQEGLDQGRRLQARPVIQVQDFP